MQVIGQGRQEKLCALCFLAASNLDDSGSDDDFDFDRANDSERSEGSFTRTRVMRDYTTGEIKGWDEFYQLVRLDDPTLSQSRQKA